MIEKVVEKIIESIGTRSLAGENLVYDIRYWI